MMKKSAPSSSSSAPSGSAPFDRRSKKTGVTAVRCALAALMARFGITDIQADAILDLKLRNLAKLEEMKIRGEQDELEQERDWLEKTLGSDARLKTLIRKELTAIAEKFGDDRRSPLAERDQGFGGKPPRGGRRDGSGSGRSRVEGEHRPHRRRCGPAR